MQFISEISNAFLYPFLLDLCQIKCFYFKPGTGHAYMYTSYRRLTMEVYFQSLFGLQVT
jgi:hypothetical protein